MLLLHQVTILSRKAEPIHLLDIRTIVLVCHSIYLKVIISKYLLHIYIAAHSEILLYVTVNPRTNLGCTMVKYYALVHAHTSTTRMITKQYGCYTISSVAAIHARSTIWYTINPVECATLKAVSCEIQA